MLAFMYLKFLYITLPLTFGIFKEHIDLHKISEVIFKNEKYNILKPTIHIVREHFEDFIQKRNNERFLTDRVYLDRNGFRHFWDGMEFNKDISLRKTNLNEKEIKLRDYNNITKSDKENLNTIVEISNRNKNKTITDITHNNKNNTTIKVKDKPRRKKKLQEDVYVPAKPDLRDDSVVIRTTFFCPYFGVIKMSTSVSNFDETKDDKI